MLFNIENLEMVSNGAVISSSAPLAAMDVRGAFVIVLEVKLHNLLLFPTGQMPADTNIVL